MEHGTRFLLQGQTFELTGAGGGSLELTGAGGGSLELTGAGGESLELTGAGGGSLELTGAGGGSVLSGKRSSTSSSKMFEPDAPGKKDLVGGCPNTSS